MQYVVFFYNKKKTSSLDRIEKEQRVLVLEGNIFIRTYTSFFSTFESFLKHFKG